MRNLHRTMLSPEGRALLDELDAEILLYRHGGPAPPTEELLERMLKLPPPNGYHLAEILAEIAHEVRRPPPRGSGR